MSDKKKGIKKDSGSRARTGSEIAPQPTPIVETAGDGVYPTYCYMCNGGAPDVIKVRVKNGIAVNLEPNYDLSHLTPYGDRGWRPCSVAMQMINRYYNPNRVKAPMKRTNPKKGRDQDPGFVEISWDEALNLVAKKLLEVKKKGFVDENGYYRICTSEGSDGTCPSFSGTFNAMFGGLTSAMGFPQGLFPSDYTLSLGGGTMCYHTEHIFGELWNKAFTTAGDIPRCNLVICFGKSNSAISGTHGFIRHADARVRGMKTIQVEPVLTTTGATADEWIPIKPGTDAAFHYAMIHHILHELNWREVCDVTFLKEMTNSPYLVAPDGLYLRDPATEKPFVWDEMEGKTKVWDAEGAKDFALDGEYVASGITIGPDDEKTEFSDVNVRPAFQKLMDHVETNTSDWAGKICDLSPNSIRRVTDMFVSAAEVGNDKKITLNGIEMPLRPVAIQLGRALNTGKGSISSVWACSVLMTLVGALEVPGGLVGSTIYYSGPIEPKTVDGFAPYPFNPTSKEDYEQIAGRRDCGSGLCPATSYFYGPMHMAYKNVVDGFPNWPKASPPDLLITFKVNLPISQNDTALVEEVLSSIPFMVSFVHIIDENAWFADVLLPEDTDFEALQIFPTGGLKFFEIYWDNIGISIKQPILKRLHNTMNVTDIITELADRTGMLAEYNAYINRGDWTFELGGTPWELELDKKYGAEEFYDRVCKAVTTRASRGAVTLGLEDFKQIGGFFGPYPQDDVYPLGKHPAMQIRPAFLYPIYKKKGMRFELPYQERLQKIHKELKRRLHERDIFWYDDNIAEIDFLPPCEIIGDIWDEVTIKVYNKTPEDYPFWLLSTRSAQHAWGITNCFPQVHEMTQSVIGHMGVQINKQAADRLGIKENDEIWIESPYKRMKGKAKLRQGIRPDVIVVTNMYGYWQTPFAKDLGIPNPNEITPSIMETMCVGGSLDPKIKVKLYKV